MKTIRRIGGMVRQVTWLVLFCWTAGQGQARTLTWTGTSFSNPTLWSLSGNWTPSFVPADGDALVFSGEASNATSFNDLVDLHVFSITFSGSGGSLLNGNSIFLDSAITCAHSCGRARMNFMTGTVTFYTFSDGYLDVEQNVAFGNNDLRFALYDSPGSSVLQFPRSLRRARLAGTKPNQARQPN